MGSIDDISQLCRLCLVKDQVNIPIFNETSDIEQIFVKINSCLPVKVSRDDNLPKKICDGCSYKLDMLYIFRNTSLDSEKQLIQWLDEAGLNSAPSEQTEVDPLANPLTSTKPEIMVKQETIEPSESRGEGDNSEICMDAQNYIIQQQKLPYEQDFDFGEPSGSSAGLMTDEPAPKRAKRTAAIKKAPLETVEDDLDAAMQITKAEEEDSDEVDQPDYVEPSTSADDQPGPSGVGKPAVEAPAKRKSYVYYNPWDSDDEDVKSDQSDDDYMPGDEESSDEDRRRKRPPQPVMCEVCGKSLSSHDHLQRHLKLHKSETPYVCFICGKGFKNKSILVSHERIHTNDKRYECDVCGKKFVQRTPMITHRRFHTGEKPYRCHLCPKAFASKGQMTLHLKNHPA